MITAWSVAGWLGDLIAEHDEVNEVTAPEAVGPETMQYFTIRMVDGEVFEVRVVASKEKGPSILP